MNTEQKEIELLNSLCEHNKTCGLKILLKSSNILIVPKISYENNQGSLHNEYWDYSVGYAFREALGIRYDKRIKNKKPYMIWMQHALINFKTWDMLHSPKNLPTLQVIAAQPMFLDEVKNELNHGSITYQHFHEKQKIKTVTQMEFLSLLIGNSSKRLQLDLFD